MAALPPLKAAVYGAAWLVRRPFTGLAFVAGGAAAAIGLGVLALVAFEFAAAAGPDARTAALAGVLAAAALAGLAHQSVVFRLLVPRDPDAGRGGVARDMPRLATAALFGAAAVAAPAALLYGAGLAWGDQTGLPELKNWGGLLGLGVGVILAVRFSLAAVATVSADRFAFFRSWGLTRGAFWALTTAYLTCAALLGGVAWGGVRAAGLIGGVDPAGLRAAFDGAGAAGMPEDPTILAVVLGLSIALSLALLLASGVAARAYLALAPAPAGSEIAATPVAPGANGSIERTAGASS